MLSVSSAYKKSSPSYMYQRYGGLCMYESPLKKGWRKMQKKVYVSNLLARGGGGGAIGYLGGCIRSLS